MPHDLLQRLQSGSAQFADVIAYIETHYHYQPTAFRNGEKLNTAHENQGSAKLFAFAQLQQLDAKDTLSLFSEHYTHVLATPEAHDHQNIRQFMQHGWAGVEFDAPVLQLKG